MDGRDAWDRQLSETSRSFALFAQYRDAGPLERSQAGLARELGLKVESVHQLAMRNSWTVRVAAWDAENERIKRATQARELESMARREVLAGQLLQSKALRRLQTMPDHEVEHLSVWELVRMLEAGVRLERMGRGEPGDLATPYTVQQTLHINTADTPIMEILRRDPKRVGPVVEALAKLQELLPELVDGDEDPDADVDDAELADLLDEPGAPEDS